MEKRKGQIECRQREIWKKWNNASNNKQDSYRSSREKGVDCANVNLLRYQTVVTLSSDSLDTLELGPISQLDCSTIDSTKSGTAPAKELSWKTVAGSNASLPQRVWGVSCRQNHLPTLPLGASSQRILAIRGTHGYIMPTATLTGCAKTLRISGRILNCPRQSQIRAQTHGPRSTRCPASATPSISRSVPASLKSKTNRPTSTTSSLKSNFRKNFTHTPTKPYLVPKSHEKYFNADRSPTFNHEPRTGWDFKQLQASLETALGNNNRQLATTPSQRSLSLSNNLSYNSLKTSKCTGYAPSSSQTSRFSRTGVRGRSKPYLFQKPQLLRRTKNESNRSLQATPAGRRAHSWERNPRISTQSMSKTYRSLSPQKIQKECKENSAARHNVLRSTTKTTTPQPVRYLSSKMTTKPPHALRYRQAKTNIYNQKRATSLSARPRSMTSSERDTPREKTSSLSVTSKKSKRSETLPKTYLSKCSPNMTKKASGVTEPSFRSQRSQSVLRSTPRSKLSAVSRIRPRVPTYSLKGNESQQDQQSKQNVQKTSFLFKFQARRWMLEPSTGCVVHCGPDGVTNTDSQDCFAAWEVTQHEVLQSCRSEDLIIMNNAVSQSPPHCHNRKSCINRWRKSKTPQSDVAPDTEKSASICQETRVYAISGTHPVLSLSGRSAHSISNIEKKSHSEYTSSTDISSPTSRWSFSSSLYSNISPTKSRKPRAGTSGPIKSHAKSRGGSANSENHKKPQKQQNYRPHSKNDMETPKQSSLKTRQFIQSRKPPGAKAPPNRVPLRRVKPRQLKTSLGISSPKRKKKKQANLGLPGNSGEKQQEFLASSNYGINLQGNISPGPDKKTFNWHNERFSEKRNIPPARLSICGKDQAKYLGQEASFNSSSCFSQRHTPQFSISPEGQLCKDTNSIKPRFVRKESRIGTSDAKKCGLVRQTSQNTLCVWKWQLLKLVFVFMVGMCHYLAFVVTITSV